MEAEPKLQRLDLLIRMYNGLNGGEALPPSVHRADQNLEREGIVGSNAGECSLVLEHVVLSALPCEQKPSDANHEGFPGAGLM